ncbi:hypothetical protein D3C85_634200 [compost metagenome]
MARQQRVGFKGIGLGLGQPAGITRTLRELEPQDHPDNDARQPFKQKHPLPTVQAADAVHFHQRTADGIADDQCQRWREVDPADGDGSILGRKPQGDHVHQRRKQTGLGDTQQHPQQVERPLTLDEHHRRRQRAPGHGDPCDPAPRPDTVGQQVARHFQQRVAKKENPRAQAIGSGADAKVRVQCRFGQRNVGPVQIRHEVDGAHQRDESSHCPPSRKPMGLSGTEHDRHGETSFCYFFGFWQNTYR